MKVGGKVLGPVSNAVAPGVAFVKGVANPQVLERLTNGIVAGAKKLICCCYSRRCMDRYKVAGGAGTVVGIFCRHCLWRYGGIYGGAKASSKYDGSAAEKEFDKKIEKNRGAIQANVEKKINAVKNVGKNIKGFFKGKKPTGSRNRKKNRDLQKQKKTMKKSYPKRSGPPGTSGRRLKPTGYDDSILRAKAFKLSESQTQVKGDYKL